MRHKILSALGLGVIFQWLSLFFSYRELPNTFEDIKTPIATGGFPFKAFEYPFPPMGNNWPPLKAWPIFFLNLIIWIIISAIIVFLLGKKIENKKIVTIIGILATVLSLFGIFYITLKFD